jgi:hypothetical protein
MPRKETAVKTILKRRVGRLFALASGALLVGTGAAFATGQVIGANNTINGCYRVADDDRKGELRVVNDPVSCRSNELPIAWNVQGPRGDQGPQGLQGPPGEQGPQGPRGPSTVFLKKVPTVSIGGGFITLASLDLPAGHYALTGTFTAHNSNTNPGRLVVSCVLGDGGGGYGIESGESQVVTIVAVQTLAAPNAVALRCWTDPGPTIGLNTWAEGILITATRVGEVIEQ